MKKVHELKTWPSVFKPTWDGVKRFDYRRNDRDYQVGDLLYLREWDPDTEAYSGLEMIFVVTYILQGGQFGIPDDYVILSFQPPIAQYLGAWGLMAERETDRHDG